MRNKKVLIYGLGKSGLAAADFFKKKGLTPYLYEDGQPFNDPIIKFFDLAVVSPGISENTDFYKKLESNSINIISELELGCQKVKGEIIAITGTNGKTTTVSLTGHILNSFVAGNIGIPLISLHGKTSRKSRIVCEVSSFQLMKIRKFKPKISAILNLAPDHLDRHRNFNDYVEAKCKIFSNQNKKDVCILNYDDELTRSLKDRIKAKVYYFSMNDMSRDQDFIGTFFSENKIYFKDNKIIRFIMGTNQIKLAGKKNIENILCAVLISLLCKVSITDIKNSVNSFVPLPNRLETVLTSDYVTYINDSKATNVASTLADINSLENNIILLLGGSDKGEDFKLLFANIPSPVHSCILYGATSENMKKCADDAGYENFVVCSKFEEAVERGIDAANELAKSGTGNVCLLLAPACASFDEFKNYEERGEKFKEIIKK